MFKLLVLCIETISQVCSSWPQDLNLQKDERYVKNNILTMYLLSLMITYTFLTNTCIERQYIKGFMNLLEHRRKRMWMRRKERSHRQRQVLGFILTLTLIREILDLLLLNISRLQFLRL